MATKWGVLSAGRIANDFVSVVQALPNNEHQFVAVAEWTLEPAHKFAMRHNIPRAYGHFWELAADPEVEVVYIAIVNSFHYPMAKLMLENGKHVLIEKPMTLNVKQAQELISLAESKNLFLMEGMWSRFLPIYHLVNDQINKGVIGDVYHININVGCPNSDSVRISKKELGGGGIVDMGVYAVDIISQVFHKEEPEQITALGHLNDEGVDVDCAAALSFKGNRIVTVTTHTLLQLPREAHICGTKGVIRICDIGTTDNEGVIKVYINGELHEMNLFNPKIKVFYISGYGLGHEAQEVRRCLKEGLTESPLMTHKDSLYLAQIEEQIRKQIGVQYECDL